MLKAMKDVVIPAIDPANRLAIEQSQLIVGMLGLMQHQLPIQFKFDRDELGRLVDMLHGLKVICDLDPALAPLPGQYKGLITESRFVLDNSLVDPAQVHEAVQKLRLVVGEVVTYANEHAGEEIRTRIERDVLNLSREQLLRDRALMAPQGWEPDPAVLPSIHALLAGEATKALGSQPNGALS
ncbi:MAG: hypothetical protein ACT4PZ_10250 [Panacagrimonas sp.]